MTDHERNLLNQFLQQLMQARVETKDPEAEMLIRNAVSRNPDAPYLLVQRALIVDQAVEAANARIAQLQQQLDRATSGQRSPAGGSFLGEQAWGRSPSQGAAMPAAAGMPGMPAGTAPASRGGLLSRLRGDPQPGHAASAYAPAMAAPGGSRMGSFLGTAAATAAGVAGGAFLFHGLSNLLGDHGGAGDAALADASASNFSDAGGQDGASQLENQFGESQYGESAGFDNAQPSEAGWADDPLADAGGGEDFGGGDFGGGDFSSEV